MTTKTYIATVKLDGETPDESVFEDFRVDAASEDEVHDILDEKLDGCEIVKLVEAQA